MHQTERYTTSKNNPPLKRLFTIPEASVYLGMSVHAIRELVWSGSLPFIQRVPRGKVFLDIHDLDFFIDQEKRSSRFGVSS